MGKNILIIGASSGIGHALALTLQQQGAGEGPAWHPTLGLLTSGSGQIYRRDREGTVSVYRPQP